MTATIIEMIPKLQLSLEKTDPAAAIKNYEAILKKDKLNVNSYNRLMILYRKDKAYKKEHALIMTAIGAFEAFYKKHQPVHSKKIASLSKAMSLSTGLTTKAGKPLNDPEPIAGWRVRLKNLEKKLT